MNILRFLFILFYFSPVENKHIHNVNDIFVDKNCKSSIEFTNCEGDQKVIYRNHDLKIRSHFVYCEKHRYVFDYELINQGTGIVLRYYNNFGLTLVIKSFTLDPGTYKVVLTIKLSSGETFLVTDKCELSVLRATLFPVIVGGLERYVLAGKKIVLDGTPSMDYSNQNPLDQNNIRYEWTYNCIGCVAKDRGWESNPVIHIPGSNHPDEARYLVKLGIRSKWWTTMVYAYQIINVKVRKQEIHIRCTINCFSEYLDQRMQFSVYCKPRCRGIKWVWSIYLGYGDDQSLISRPLELKLSEEGSATYNLRNFDGIVPGQTYLLKVGPKTDNSTKASYKFKSMKEYDFSCLLLPFQGIVLETHFYFRCEGEGYGVYFWVTLVDHETKKEMKIDSDSLWKYLNFTVPRRGTVFLRFAHYNGLEGEISYDPDIPEDNFKLIDKELDPSEIDDTYNKGDDAIQNSLESFEYDKALDKMSLISKSVEKINSTEVKKLEPVIGQIVSDLRKVPLATISHIEQATGIMEDLTSRNVSFDTPLTKKMSKLCKDLSAQHSKTLGEQYLESPSDKNVLETTVSQLMKCSVGVSKPDESAIQVRDAQINVTTVSYLLIEGETNTEVYEEYLDEVISLENKEQYKTVSSDFLDICINNGESLSKRINLQRPNAQHTKTVTANNYRITVSKRPGHLLVNNIYQSFGVQVKFPADLRDNDDIYSAIICTTSLNIFWWEHGVELVGNVVVVIFTPVSKVTKPVRSDFEISFKIIKEPTLRFSSKTYKITPNIPDISVKHQDESLLPVYIIALEAGRSLFIEFSDIKENISLDVTITDFELPIGKYSTGKSYRITQNLSYFVDDLVSDQPGYRLMSVKSDNSNQMDQIDFKMRAFGISCLKWIPEKKMWKVSCKAKLSLTGNDITCFCHDLSLITATMEEVEIKVWQDYKPLKLNIEEQYFHIISIFMVFLYLLYFTLLCFSIREVDYTTKSIYFLSDVSRQNLYGYVIVTKTGRAGTTSNVTIRIIGKKAESDPHVLNYPDPLLKILQKGEEDWFFLASKVHLGKILEIELWYDGIGGLPYWYCKTVNVFDIQNDQWYEFRVASFFNIFPKPKVYAREKAIDTMRSRSIKVKLLKLLSSLRPDYRIFSLSLRQIDECRSYVKRLTLMFSIVISIGFWCIIFNGIPQKAPIDSIMKFCEYKINYLTVSYGIISSIVAAVYHLPIIHVFTSSPYRFSHDGSPYKHKLPYIITIICWSVVIILITIQSTFIICFGVWIPTVDAYLWITSIAIGLIFYIFLIETISGIIMRYSRGNYDEYEIYVKKKLKKIMLDIEKQRDVLYAMFGKYLLRPFLQHLYKPMEKSKLTYRLAVAKMKYEVRELLENLVMFVIYTSLMYMIILENRDHYSVNSNKQISSLMQGSYTKTFALDGVISISNLEEYIENTLIVVTQSRVWYGKYAVRDPGMTVDYNNKMLGVIRIRQYRSLADTCEVPEIMNFTNRTCNGDYFKSQSSKDYGLRWSTYEPSSSEGRMANIWKFVNSSETGTLPFIGKLGIYAGGGYVSFLGRGMKNSYINFNYLQYYSWFDVLTRGIFIEFLLYNTNSNIFNSVQFTIEKSVTGYLKIEVVVDTAKMLADDEKKFDVLDILLGVFVVIVLFLSVRTLLRIFRTGVWYFKDLWHLIDILLISLSYSCIFLYYKRSAQVGALLEALEGVEPREFVDYFSLYRVDHAFTITAALLITVATIKLWLLFRFLLVFKVAERTFSTMFVSLCALLSYHLVSLIAFSFFGYILFVDHLYRFAGMVNTVELLSELNIRSFSEEERTVLNAPRIGLGYIFYILYSFTVMITNNIYTSMIVIFYSKAKEDLSDYHEGYSIKAYLKTQFLFYYNLAKVRLKYLRLKAGGKVKSNYVPIEPKADEHRFADCFTLGIDKLRAMSLVSLCVLKNSNPKRKPLSQRDIRLMTYTLYYLKRMGNEPEDESEVERFYKADLGANKVKLIPEFNLTKIEAAASILLGQSREETMAKLNINGDSIIREEIKQGIQEVKNELSLMLDALNKVNIITL